MYNFLLNQKDKDKGQIKVLKQSKKSVKQKWAEFKTIMSNQDYGEQDCCHEGK